MFELRKTLDISCVRQIHTYEEIEKMCEAALEYQLAAVFVMPAQLPLAAKLLQGQKAVKTASVISFPDGMNTTAGKLFQAKELKSAGCNEFDMVMNLSWLRNGEYTKIAQEIQVIKAAVEPYELKVIIEVSLLSDEEIKRACDAVILGKADYVKTGTGWAGATTYEIVRKIREFTGESIKVKAAGGIDSATMIRQMYEMGCTRFGIGMRTWERLQKDI